MRDIAAAAGVSPSAVSLALAGKGRMEDSTRARILATATELGYRINREARALRTGRTMMIGLVTSMVADQVDDHESRLDWYTRTALAAANESFRHGYALVLVPPLGTISPPTASCSSTPTRPKASSKRRPPAVWRW